MRWFLWAETFFLVEVPCDPRSKERVIPCVAAGRGSALSGGGAGERVLGWEGDAEGGGPAGGLPAVPAPPDPAAASPCGGGGAQKAREPVARLRGRRGGGVCRRGELEPRDVGLGQPRLHRQALLRRATPRGRRPESSSS